MTYLLTHRYVRGKGHEPEIHELAIISPSGTKVWELEVGPTRNNMICGILEAEKWVDEHIRNGRNHVPKAHRLNTEEVDRYIDRNGLGQLQIEK